ncbi:peptide chain release factor 1 [Coniophora puteana RWD-64-598 SS2]|uniref:Peptide chain release factor 1 n=1 Tax=Coniophora puteana (strain RWD-64-598) TaxID=741705 RepID=R7SG16_CONPW|nr:peptide chain release factor 1 [Coniophora puteana RWD-64-598 SS2]EIW74029.1 peptide chain release factor 1 [Coniophora puteana RWD-64-598 SS2]
MSEDMSSPDDIARLKQAKELEPLCEAWSEYASARAALRETIPLLSDSDPSMRALAAEEAASLTETLSNHISTRFPSLVLPRSRTAHLGALLELKPGVGGDEAALFAADLLRVYARFAGSVGRKWQTAVLGAGSMTDTGGVKEVTLEVRGAGAYDALRWESGVHRVQRVPATESNGRVHTSTVACLVLPLVEEDASHGEDELFSMDDVRVEVMRARGAGGQHVNKTESAVRLTHVPTGITVSMQDERSQHQNRRRAFQVLRSRLLDQKITRDIADRRAARRSLVRTVDRSEKIRTYNYAQERVTDHRIGLSIMNLSSFLEGEALQVFLDGLQRRADEEAMEELMGDMEKS